MLEKLFLFSCSKAVIITARKWSLGQGNIFAPVCHSVHRGGLPGRRPPRREAPPTPPEGGTPGRRHAPAKDTPWKEAPPRPTPKGGNWGGSGPGPHPRGKLRRINPGSHPRGKLRGIRSKLTPKGEIEGDQIQAHTQRGNWGGSDLGPHPRGKLRGIRSRPTPKGEIEGDQNQAPPHDDYCCGRYASYWNAFLFYRKS